MTDAELDSLVASARQHALGDLPRRTAARTPDRTALVDGEVRLSFAELDAVIDRAAAALAARGLVKGDRLALLSHNCWQFAVLSFATARLGVVLVPVNFMLGVQEVAFILEHSGAVAMVVEDALGEVAEAAATDRVRVRGRLALAGLRRRAGLGGRRRLVRRRGHPAAGRRRRRRPAAPHVHLGHGVAPEGRPAEQPLPAVAVRVVRRRGRHDRRRRRGPRAAALPLRAARLLPRAGRLPRRDQHRAARAGPGRPAADHRARAGHEAVLPADGVDLAAALPRLRHHRPVVAAQGLLRRLADARGGAARDAAAAARRAAVELLRADRDGSAGDPAAAGGAAQPGGLGRAGGAQRRDAGRRRRRPSRPGRHRRRDRPPQPARHAGLLRGPGEDGRGVPRRLVPQRRPRRARRSRAGCPSSTARRT